MKKGVGNSYNFKPFIKYLLDFFHCIEICLNPKAHLRYFYFFIKQ